MLGYWKALVFVLGTITILVLSNSEHEDIDFDELDKEIKLRRSYWKLSQARDQISDTVGVINFSLIFYSRNGHMLYTHI